MIFAQGIIIGLLNFKLRLIQLDIIFFYFEKHKFLKKSINE